MADKCRRTQFISLMVAPDARSARLRFCLRSSVKPFAGNGNSADGRDHWPYCYTAVMAGAGIKRGYIHGKSDKTGSAPLEDPVHPGELLATIYHAFGIDPATIVYNHLKQPRELVKADAVGRLFA